MDHRLSSRSCSLLLALTLPAASLAQQVTQQGTRTTAQKVADAMSAAPASITRDATIMDWPATAGAEMQQLRAGSNGWVCYPTTPIVYANGAKRDPMCLDQEFQGWASAWMNKAAPQTRRTGLAYMLQGDAGASNTDPFATGPTADNHWVTSGPHIMVLVPDVSSLNEMTGDPSSGGPWVMWKGTPYAHIMVPVLPPQTKAQRAPK